MAITLMLFVGVAGCVRADQTSLQPVAIDPRVAIDEPSYGGDPSQPALLALGDRLELDHLPAGEGQTISLTEARAIGPVVLVWLGGAEHAGLIEWVRELASALPELEARGATLVIVRPLPPDRADAFAADLDLQAVVAADEHGELAMALGWVEPLPEWALLVVDRQSTLRYRKLAGRRPGLDELLAAIEGRAPRCCVDECERACE
ncbi:redoxin domain-containing protein [Nannocystaceae bacterium ST9]